MKKDEIVVGGKYLARVSGVITTVRVDRIREVDGWKKATTHYDVTNLRTGRQTTFHSAAKFRSVVPEAQTTGLSIGPNGGLTMTPIAEGEQSLPPQTTTDESTPAPSAGTIGATAPVQTSDQTEEGEERPDPTPQDASPVAGAGIANNGLASRITAARTGRQRGTPVAGMVPNEEQEAIIEIAESMGLSARMEGNVLVIAAGAGTGKTATLKMLEQIIRGRGQYTAFNSALVAESKAKFTKCAVNTTHSLAFRAVGKLYAHRLGGERMRSGQVARILGIEPITLILKGQGPLDEVGKATDKVKLLSAEFLAGQVMVAIRKFCQSADPEVGEQHFKYIDGIDSPLPSGKRGRENNDLVRDRLLGVATTAWGDLSRVDGTLPFNHDCYVKLWQLGRGDDRPIIAADYILLDEAQDTAPVFLDILKQQKHALLVLVGDDNQQIYEWRGAVNAMGAFPGAPRRLLSQSYRFGQAVADVANSVLAELEEPTDLVMRGLHTLPSRVAVAEAPRCYLYRTNAGAVGRVMQAVATGKRPHLIGGGSDVVAWCEAAIELQAKRPTRHPELCCFDSWTEVEEYSKTDEGSDLRLMVKLVNEFGAEEIRHALKDMPKEEQADLVVSTAHKSKGREWESVKLGPDFPTANKMADSDRRLLYVAVTRAKLNLDLSECPPFCGGKDHRDVGDDGWVPGLVVTYTQPMPTEQEQRDWLSAQEERAEKEFIDRVNSEPLSVNQVKQMFRAKDDAQDIAASKEQARANTANGGFTWTKFDGGWFVRGPANTPVGTSVTVTRKDGTSSRSTIRTVKHKFNDAWIYGL